MSKKQFHLKPLCALLLLAFAAQTAQANPTGAAVVNGQASFAVSGNTLTVTNTPGAIINWQGFSIDANEVTRFVQQNASSTVLNRVTGNNPSSILGSLQSNGRVFLVNPGGIVFGQGATVDVAGMVATSLNLSDADFLAGRHNFTGVPGAQNVSNAGNISAQAGGQIYLIAPNVENTGVITAPDGEILLAAGHSVDLVNSNDPDLRVTITAPAGDATNVGQLIAGSGSLGLFGAVVKHSGAASADSVTLQGGKIVFKASNRAEISGAVSANGATGGNIRVLGNQVGILDGATVTANGTQGGGTILIGGDAHGGNPGVQNAQATYVAQTARINADASDTGNGGKVVVWADNATQFNGNISAQGGANGGDGGWVEVSGKRWLGYAGLVTTSAAKGATGSLLLDPMNITISVAANTGTMTWTPGTFTFSDPSTGLATSNLNVVTLANQLASTNVIVNTSIGGMGGTLGDITVSDDIIWANANSLTLLANNNITINAAINTMGGDVLLNSDSDGLNGGAIVMNTGSSITCNCNVTLGGGTAGDGTGNAVGNATYVDGIWLNGASINSGAGSIALNGQSNGSIGTDHGVLLSGATLTTSGGAITVNGTGDALATSGMHRGIRIAGASTLTAYSSIDLTGTAGYDGDGVQLVGGSTVQSTMGAIAVTGTSGDGLGADYGVWLSGAGTQITSGNGITIQGDSTNALTGASNRGLIVELGAQVIATGTGNISMTGLGGWDGDGVQIKSGALIQSSSGSTTIAGTSGDAAGFALGTWIGGAGTLVTSGGGMSITGTSTATSGSGNVGLGVDTGAKITTTVGQMTLAGANGFGADSDAVFLSGTPAGGLVNAAAGLAINGTGDVLLDAGSVINAGGNANISATNNILLAAGSSIAPSAGAVNVSLISNSDSANGGGIYLDTGSSINSNGGNIRMGGVPLTGYATGNGTVTGGIAFNSGIYVLGSLTAGAGSISLRGTGAATNFGYGIYTSGSALQTTTGSISLTGVGGAGGAAAQWDTGVMLDGASTVNSASGNIDITGTGAGADMGMGILAQGGTQVTTGGNGTITLTGTGGGTGNSNHGVNFSSSSATTSAGMLQVTGTSTGTTGENDAVLLTATSSFKSTSGGIVLDGANLTGAGTTPGVTIAGQVESLGSATISVIARSGNAGFGSLSNRLGGTTALIGGASASGAITLTANNSAGSNAIDLTNLKIQGSGSLILQPLNPGTTIGVAGGTGTFNLSTASLNSITPGFSNITIGRINGTGAIDIGTHSWNDSVTFRNPGAGAGGISVTGATSLAAGKNLTLASGGGITQAATAAISAGSLAIKAAGNVALDSAPNMVGTLAGSITGAGTEYFHFKNNGGFTIGMVDGVQGISIANIANYTAASPNGVIALQSFGGNITQTANGSLGGAAVWASSSSGSVDLTAANNPTGILAGSAYGGFSYKSGSPIALMNVDGHSGITSAMGGNIVLIGTGFTNSLANPFTVSVAGRWLVYAPAPSSVTKGGLTSDFRHYSGTYASYPPVSVTETGNGFIYAAAPGALSVNTTLVSGSPFHTYGATPTAQFGYVIGNPAIADNEDLALITGTPVFTPTISSVTPAGSYTVKYASGLSNPVYTFITGTGIAYTVNPAALTLITVALNGTVGKTYDGTSTATLVPGNFLLSGFVAGDSATVTKTTGTYASKNVGSGILVSTALVATDFNPVGSTNLANYILPTSASGHVGKITPAPMSVAAHSQSKVYGSADPALTYVASGLLFNDTLTGELDRAAGEDVGSYAIGLGSLHNSNYTISYAGGDLSISPASLTVAAHSQSKVYGSADPALTYAASGLLFNDTLTGELDRAAGENVGSYAIGLGSLHNPNYTISYTGGDLSITQAALTVAANNASKTYDATPYSGGNGVTYSGLTNGDTAAALGGALTYGGTSQGAVNAGSYTIVPGGLTSGNYTISYVDGALTINPAALGLMSVSANDASKTYGDTLTFTGSEFTPIGLLGGDTIGSVTLTSSGAVDTANVGTYAITPSNAVFSSGNASNYTLTYIDGQLTVNPALLTVTADAISKTAGNVDPSLTYTTAGLKLADTEASTLSGALARMAGETAGTYQINQGTLTLLGGNYAMNYIPADFTVLPAPATPPIVDALVDNINIILPGLPFDPPKSKNPIDDPEESDEKEKGDKTAAIVQGVTLGAESGAAATLPVCK